MILPIIEIGADTLIKESKPVKKTDSFKNLIDNMLDSMYHKHGIGLAGVQVGVLKRLFVIDIPEISGGPKVFINPVIKNSSHDLIEYEEGCLSVPGIRAKVERPRAVELSYYDQNFTHQQKIFNELFAVCIQHELDHLNGILFLERLKKSEIHKTKKELKKVGFSEELLVTINFGSKSFSLSNA